MGKQVITKESIMSKLSINEKAKKNLIRGVIVIGVVGGAVVLYKLHCTKVNELTTEIAKLTVENTNQEKEISRLIGLCFEKDEYFREVISDAFRHGSSLGAKHMADLRWLPVA